MDVFIKQLLSKRAWVTFDSRHCIMACFYSSITLAILSVLSGYALWLQQGCRPFLPFISDLGAGSSATLFKYGMSSSAMLMVPVWFNFYYETGKLMKEGTSCGGRVIHKSLTLAGCICSVGVFLVAANPMAGNMTENTVHTYSSIVVFVSGLVFIFIDLAFSYVIGRSKKFTSCTLLVAAVALISGWQNFMAGYARTWDKGSITLMQYHYEAYCRGERMTFHSDSDMNYAALCEWVLIGSFVSFIFAQISAAWGSHESADEFIRQISDSVFGTQEETALPLESPLLFA